MNTCEYDALDLFRKPTHLIKRNEEDISCAISKTDLRTQIELFCAKVKHPVTIFSFYDKDSNGRLERVDSAISSVSLHYCCETFRICAGIKYCEQSDLDHALLFKGEDEPIHEDEMEEKVNKNIKNYIDNKYNLSDYYNASSPAPVFEKYEDGQGGYLSYFCPILGYKELVFPIVVCKRVLGAIFCGQVCYGSDELIKNIRYEFLKQKPNIFENYIKDHPNIEKKDLINIYKVKNVYPISKEDKKVLLDNCWINERRPESLTEDDYKLLIKNIRLALEFMTKELYDHMVVIKKNYVTQTIKRISYDFCQEAMKEILPIDNEKSIAKYWHCVETHLSDAVNKLALRDIQVYGTMNPETELDSIDKLKMVAFSCPFADNDVSKWIKNNYFFKLEPSDKDKKLPFLSATPFNFGNLNINETSNLKNRIIDTNGYVDKYSSHTDVLYYPVYDNLNHSSAMIIDYYETKNCSNLLNDNEFIYETIITEIYPFSNLIFYLGAYLLNSLLQITTEMVLRFFKHELSHVLVGFNYLNETYVQDFDFFAKIDIKKRNDVVGDFASTEEMMKAITNNIEMLTKPDSEIKLKIEEFKIFKELLHKWENLYRHDIKQKRLSFYIPNINFDDPNRPLIKSDKRLLEQIIYNIVHNAIKYSNKGTKIEIDCKKKNDKSKTQILTITDYGAEIENNENPYKLYYRSPDVKQTIEGSGIGLFVVKRIAEILGLKVRHYCEKVSDYNVSYINAYIYKPFVDINKDKDLLRILQEENNRLDKLLKLIVSDSNETISLGEQDIAVQIYQPTYKVTFEVEI